MCSDEITDCIVSTSVFTRNLVKHCRTLFQIRTTCRLSEKELK